MGERRNTLAVGRTLFRWCVKPPRRYIKHSPLEGVELPKPKKRKRILSDDEMRTVWGSADSLGYPFGPICKLLMLTGQRRTEIASLRRDWINEKEQTIILPDWLTKNKKEHTFPYNGMARRRRVSALAKNCCFTSTRFADSGQNLNTPRTLRTISRSGQSNRFL